ncbi:hypothetical protein [Actinoplanes rectilineatus]
MQAEKFGADFITDDVSRVELSDNPTGPGTEGLRPYGSVTSNSSPGR